MRLDQCLYCFQVTIYFTKAQFSKIEVLVAMPMTRWEFMIVPCLAGGNASATCLKMLVMRFAVVQWPAPLNLHRHFAAQYKSLVIIIIIPIRIKRPILLFDYICRIVEIYERSSQEALADPEWHLANPVNAYLVIKRLIIDFNKVIKIHVVGTNDEGQLFCLYHTTNRSRKWPKLTKHVCLAGVMCASYNN